MLALFFAIGNSESPSGGCYYAIDNTDKLKAKASNSDPHDVIRTTTTNSGDFFSLKEKSKRDYEKPV